MRIYPTTCVHLVCLAVMLVAQQAVGQTPAEPLRIGVIGLDTSHAPAFAKLFNSPEASGPLTKMEVVVAFPGGSPDIASSRDRVDNYTTDFRKLGIDIASSVEEVIGRVDAVIINSLDGRTHLEQAAPVFAAGKPVFIDKPLGANLTDVLAIDLLAREHSARWFSSSSLRFSPSIWKHRANEQLAASVRGAASWGPCSIEPTHVDLFWYGIHGVETLYTAMGQGCQTVSRIDGQDIVVVGTWKDGRIGTFRGILDGKQDYGLAVFGKQAISIDGKYEGYKPLVEQIAGFFLGAPAPVATAETVEIFTFMQAAQLSHERNGAPVNLAVVKGRAMERALELVQKYDTSR